jgi:hypothetical protein
MIRRATTVTSKRNSAGNMTQPQPTIRPSLRCRPDRVQGMPVARETRCLALVIPTARFHENPPLLAMVAPFVLSAETFGCYSSAATGQDADLRRITRRPFRRHPHGRDLAPRVWPGQSHMHMGATTNRSRPEAENEPCPQHQPRQPPEHHYRGPGCEWDQGFEAEAQRAGARQTAKQAA